MDDLSIVKKIKTIIEDPENMYVAPFSEPKELMLICDHLEEKNLFLIQQGQENQKQYEQKDRDFQQIRSRTESEFNNLESREREMQNRIDKMEREFDNLKAETLDDHTKIIEESKYLDIKSKAKKILAMFLNKDIKDLTKDQAPIIMLLLIEQKIEQAEEFINSCQSAGTPNENFFVDALRAVKSAIRTQKAINEAAVKREKEDK